MYDNTDTIECKIVMYCVLKEFLTDGASVHVYMNAHTPVISTGSEKSWNGGREGKIMNFGGEGDS